MNNEQHPGYPSNLLNSNTQYSTTQDELSYSNQKLKRRRLERKIPEHYGQVKLWQKSIRYKIKLLITTHAINCSVEVETTRHTTHTIITITIFVVLVRCVEITSYYIYSKWRLLSAVCNLYGLIGCLCMCYCLCDIRYFDWPFISLERKNCRQHENLFHPEDLDGPI